MRDLFFLFRAFVLTILAILALQIKVGDHTLEQKSEAWLRTSGFVGYIQEVADGAMVVVDHWLDKLDDSFATSGTDAGVSSKDAPGRRHLAMRLERSKSYIKGKAKQAKAALKKGIDKVQNEYFDEEEEFTEEPTEE